MNIYDINGNIIGGTSGLIAIPVLDGTAIISHRGLSSAPENTLIAWEKAIEKGCKILEGDIDFSSDGIPVMLHDSTINRTSNGTGTCYSHTLSELKSYDFGSWKGIEYAGEQIPTLEEFLMLCKKNHAIAELDFAEKTYSIGESNAVTAIYNTVKQCGMLNNVIFTAKKARLDVLMAIDSNVIVSASGMTSTSAVDGVSSIISSSKRCLCSVPVANLSQSLVNYIHMAGGFAKVWTYNTKAEIETAFGMGVEFVLSDSITQDDYDAP